MSDHQLIDAIWDYLSAWTPKHGQQHTAERLRVSRQTPWQASIHFCSHLREHQRSKAGAAPQLHRNSHG